MIGKSFHKIDPFIEPKISNCGLKMRDFAGLK